MSKQTIKNLIIFVSLLAIIGVFFAPRETLPSGDTRIILEHTYETYIAAPCFQVAEASNFLQDSTLETAMELDYEPHNECTADALKGEKEILIISLLRDMGILDKKWDEW